jgi:hypothetical protein
LHHPNRSPNGGQCDNGGGNGENGIQCADRGHMGDDGRRTRGRWRRGTRSGGRNRSSTAWPGSRRGRSRCRNANRGSASRSRRTTGRQRRQLDGRGSRRLGRQIDSDGFFLGLDFAGFLFRGNCPCRDIWDIVSHKFVCKTKLRLGWRSVKHESRWRTTKYHGSLAVTSRNLLEKKSVQG